MTTILLGWFGLEQSITLLHLLGAGLLRSGVLLMTLQRKAQYVRDG